MHGEKTYVFLLERKKEIDSHCHASHLYRPLLLPFVSAYNDYGDGENSEGVAFPLIMKALKTQLIEMPVGKNEYHDIAVTRDAWNEALLFESMRENRLRVPDYYGEPSEVDFVMMRQDVVDDLTKTYQFEEYLGEGQGTHGWKNSYQYYGFDDIIADVDPLLEAIVRIMQEKNWPFPEMGMLTSAYLDEPGACNRAAKWLRHDSSYQFFQLVRTRGLVIELLIDGQKDRARELLIEHLRGMFVNIFMELTRRSWIPGGQEGSQQQDHRPYRALMDSMDRSIKAYQAKWEEEDLE